jgi:arsenate reductase
MEIKVFHNSRCYKSRFASDFLTKKKITFETIEYLKIPLITKLIIELIRKLGIPAKQLVLTSDVNYSTQNKGKVLSEAEWIKAMMEFPKLIERLIVLRW